MSLSQITTWPVWSLHLSEINIMYAVKTLYTPKKFWGLRDTGHTPFEKFLRGHVWTVHGKMRVTFEVHSFNCFKLVWLTGLLCTHRHTSNEHIISAIHFVHLAEIVIPLVSWLFRMLLILWNMHWNFYGFYSWTSCLPKFTMQLLCPVWRAF